MKSVILFLLMWIPSLLVAQEVPVTVVQPPAEEPAEEPAPVSAPAVVIEEEPTGWQWGIGVGFQLASLDAKFSSAEYTGPLGNRTGNASVDFKRAAVLVLEGQYLPRKSWGFQGGMNYEGERRVESTKFDGGGYVGPTGGSDGARVQFTTFYGSAVYRWNEFYIPMGLNYSVVKSKTAVGVDGTFSGSGGLGAQIGAGWKVSEHFSLELYSWVTTMKLKSEDATRQVNYGNGRLGSLVLVTKVSF